MTFSLIKDQSLRLADLGAELVFTQDDQGEYHSFYWNSSLIFPLSSLGEKKLLVLEPVNKLAYLEKIREVLNRGIPEQYDCLLSCQDNFFPFKLIISPIISPQGKAKLVLVMGYHVSDETPTFNSSCGLKTGSGTFQNFPNFL